MTDTASSRKTSISADLLVRDLEEVHTLANAVVACCRIYEEGVFVHGIIAVL